MEKASLEVTTTCLAPRPRNSSAPSSFLTWNMADKSHPLPASKIMVVLLLLVLTMLTMLVMVMVLLHQSPC